MCEIGLYFEGVFGVDFVLCVFFSPRTSEFIAQQLQIISAMQAEQEKLLKESDERKQKRQHQYHQQQGSVVPPLPEP
jgi:hypothetical protein